jgi:hypothetical protein
MSRTALVTLLALAAAQALADDKPKPPANAEAAMMEAYTKHATPGPAHKKLDPLAGRWTYTAKFWMAPDQPPMEMKGTAERKWIMGGRFLQDDVNNEGVAMPFQGLGLTGYDNHLKKYVGTWVDSMTTSIMHSVGEVDASGKVFTMRHEDFDPMFNQTIKSRDVTRITGPDSHTIEFYRTMPDGKETKAGEIHFTRKK